MGRQMRRRKEGGGEGEEQEQCYTKPKPNLYGGLGIIGLAKNPTLHVTIAVKLPRNLAIKIECQTQTIFLAHGFWVILAHSGSLWLILAYSASFKLILAYSGSFWLTLAHSGSSWLTLALWVIVTDSG